MTITKTPFVLTLCAIALVPALAGHQAAVAPKAQSKSVDAPAIAAPKAVSVQAKPGALKVKGPSAVALIEFDIDPGQFTLKLPLPLGKKSKLEQVYRDGSVVLRVTMTVTPLSGGGYHAEYELSGRELRNEGPTHEANGGNGGFVANGLSLTGEADVATGARTELVEDVDPNNQNNKQDMYLTITAK